MSEVSPGPRGSEYVDLNCYRPNTPEDVSVAGAYGGHLTETRSMAPQPNSLTPPCESWSH